MKKRPTFVSIIAGYLILCSVVGTIVFSVALPTADTIQTNGESAVWVVEHLGRGGLLAVALVVYLFAAAVGFGLWKLQMWARQALMFACSFLAIASIIVAAVVLVRTRTVDVGSIVVAAVFALPLYYFNRPNIKALFT